MLLMKQFKHGPSIYVVKHIITDVKHVYASDNTKSICECA